MTSQLLLFDSLRFGLHIPGKHLSNYLQFGESMDIMVMMISESLCVQVQRCQRRITTCHFAISISSWRATLCGVLRGQTERRESMSWMWGMKKHNKTTWLQMTWDGKMWCVHYSTAGCSSEVKESPTQTDPGDSSGTKQPSILVLAPTHPLKHPYKQLSVVMR